MYIRAPFTAEQVAALNRFQQHPGMHRWLTDPDGGGRFTRQRDAILAHDPACSGLKDVWLPRKGGVSCPSDLTDCHGGCGVTFFNEGTVIAFEDCPESWHYYCACCLARTEQCPCATADTTGDAR